MEIRGVHTSIFSKGDSLSDFIIAHVKCLNDGDILVVTSKIVALSQERTAKITEYEKCIQEESQKIIRTPWAFLTLTEEGWGINAGIDKSNAKNQIILLPENPFEVALELQKQLSKHFSLKKFGVIITDTRSMPLRKGTIGRALGFAGFKPLKNYVGMKDLFGRKSRVTQSNHADALSAAAVCMMGEGNEQIPIAIIKNAPVAFTSRPLTKADQCLYLLPEDDIFSKVFERVDLP